MRLDKPMLTRKAKNSSTIAQVILILSDQDKVSDSWKSLFHQKGCMTVCETQENALQTCRIVDPALIVVDLDLPHVQKLDLFRGLRGVTSAPILMLIPNWNGDKILDAYNAGVDECLLKPVSPAFLVVKSMSWLLRHRWIGHDPSLSPVRTTI